MTKRFKSPSNPVVFLGTTLLLLIAGNVLGQTVPVATRDPNAVALAGRALQALAGTAPLTDITLQASAMYVAGSDQEMGPATLIALGNQLSSVTLSLTNGQRQQIRNGTAGVWIGPDGVVHAILSHNCFVDASWFYPAFTLVALASDPTLAISLVGQEVHAGEAVYHLTLYRVISNQPSTVLALIQGISTMDLYLDAATLLPADFDFNLHPDQNTGINIPFEIRYSAYQSFGGVQAPTRIQEYIQNTLTLDLTVANVAVNSGVPASTFTLPAVAAGGAQ